MKQDPRHTALYKKLRKTFRQTCQTKQLPCWLCEQPIDYNLPARHPEAFELDHINPVTSHPEQANNPNNFKPSHRLCNQTKSNKTHTTNLGTLSRNWLNPTTPK
ncbi:HNH endonuclease [Leucobacter sp. OH1287]|uniref:HNH endonuclease n=1 Tax=Leucobacter sp. OH1287 TaxID=2491049 RepID=UPI000F5E804F|nr:hypothetical protein EII30_02105 [Leucobacter sp. OH1287]